MKLKTDIECNNFKPVTLTITLDSLDEVKALRAMSNPGGETLRDSVINHKPTSSTADYVSQKIFRSTTDIVESY